MHFNKKLEKFFLLIIFIALGVLAKNYYTSHTFKDQPLSQKNQQRITLKEKEILQNMRKAFGYEKHYDLNVTDKFPGRLYGLTTFNEGKITIYLNKKVMQESMDYMVESVIAHEYAHALMFSLGHFEEDSGGHTEQWKEICQKLGGKDCRPYVDQKEIIMSKMPF